MTRVEAVIQCTECKTELSRVDAVEERPGFWVNTPAVPIPVVCPVCEGTPTRKEHMEKFEAQRASFELAKEFSRLLKPGGVENVR